MSTLCLQNYQNFAIVPDCERFSRKRSRDSPFSLDLSSPYEDVHLINSLQGPKREKLSPPVNQTPEFGASQIFDTSDFCRYLENSAGASLNLFSNSAAITLPPLPSGMQQQTHLAPRSSVDQATQPELLIREQPEEYYRARYGSEGVRAPLKGLTESYPTVQVVGIHGKFTGNVSVKLVHEDGTAHSSCSLDNSEDRKQALSKKIGYGNSSGSIEFEDLRIRREKKKEGRKATASEKVAAKDRDDKKACLLFTANLQTADRGEISLQARSNPISLTTAPEPAELDLIHPNTAHYGRQDLVIIKGSKMTSPKVEFILSLPNATKPLTLHGVVDKERSHQNVLLVKTPSLLPIMDRIGGLPVVRAKVVVTTGRNQMSSNQLDFEFIQDHVCRECGQLYPPQDSRPLPPPLPPTHTAPQPPNVCSPPPVPTPISVVSPMPQMTEFTSATSSTEMSVNISLGLTDALCHPVFTSDGSLGQNSAISPNVYCSTANTQSPSLLVPSTPPSSRCQTYEHEDSLLTPVGSVVYTPQADSQADKPNEDSSIMLLVEKLMEEQEQSSQPLYAAASFAGMEQGTSSGGQPVGSPFLPDVSSATSPTSDTLCYSPVTPVQSPADGIWNRIEMTLKKLLENGHIDQNYFKFWSSQSGSQSAVLFSAYTSSCNDDMLFLQQLLLASQKLQSFQSSTQQ